MEHMPLPEQSTAIDKALDVLFFLHSEAEPRGVTEIGRALAMPKSTTHRLLSALRRRALVEQDEGGRYRPGVGVLVLAAGLLDREPLVVAAQAVLERAAADFGETFFLVAARAGRLLVLAKAEGTGVLRVSPAIGSEVPALATAVGKLYLAHAPHLLDDSRPTRYTVRTIVDPDRLARDVDVAARRGFAVNDEEWLEDVSVVAAPVFVEGGLGGGVCTAMSGSRFASCELADIGRRVIHAATSITSRMEGGA
jgi:IclR family acetate operon transcriptional repressor